MNTVKLKKFGKKLLWVLFGGTVVFAVSAVIWTFPVIAFILLAIGVFTDKED